VRDNKSRQSEKEIDCQIGVIKEMAARHIPSPVKQQNGHRRQPA
jgi:hypothetical protein